MNFRSMFGILFCVITGIFFQLREVECKEINEFCRRDGDLITCEGIILGERQTDYGVFDFGSSKNCSIKVQKSFIPILYGGIFRKWSGITSLILSNIGLTSIVSRIIFEDAEQLHTLDLSYNKLTKLDDGNFKFLTGLRHLDLSNNRLTKLNWNVFNGLTSLEYLNLKGNGIESLYESPVTLVHKLEKLDLSENAISYYSKDMFRANIHLKHLQLRGAFKKLADGTEEYLFGNRYSNNRFKQQIQIGKHDRRFFVTISSMFGHMKKLEFLDVSENPISLDVRAFSEMKQLSYLNLSSTGLSDDSIQYGQFTNTKKLEILDLSHNQLTNFDTEILAFLSNLTQLYLNDNKLHDGFDYRQLESNKNLSYINLSNNNWQCKLLTKMLENFYSRYIRVDFSSALKDSINVEGIKCVKNMPKLEPKSIE